MTSEQTSDLEKACKTFLAVLTSLASPAQASSNISHSKRNVLLKRLQLDDAGKKCLLLVKHAVDTAILESSKTRTVRQPVINLFSVNSFANKLRRVLPCGANATTTGTALGTTTVVVKEINRQVPALAPTSIPISPVQVEQDHKEYQETDTRSSKYANSISVMGPSTKQDNGVINTTEDMGPPVRAGEQRKPSRWYHSLSARRIFDNTNNSSRSLSDKKPALWLVPAYPPLKLSPADSECTVMQKLLSRRVSNYINANPKFCLRTCLLFLAIAIVIHNFRKSSKTMGLVNALTEFLSVTWVWIWISSKMNWRLTVSSLRLFDTWIYTIEASSYCLSWIAMSCFDVETAARQFFLFCALLVFPLFDTLALDARKLCGLFTAFMYIFCFYYFWLLWVGERDADIRCDYYWSWSQGIVLNPGSNSTSTSSSLIAESSATSNLTASATTCPTIARQEKMYGLRDFFVSRSLNITILMSKILWTIARHPFDCAVLKSRLRVIKL